MAFIRASPEAAFAGSALSSGIKSAGLMLVVVIEDSRTQFFELLNVLLRGDVARE